MPAGLAWREEAPGDDAALVARLAAPGGLVVVGGGPCAVPPAARLCLLHGIPFLAPDAPALRMAIDPRDAGAVLAPPVPAGLALALQRAIDRRPAAARPAAGPPDWAGFVAQLLCVPPPAPAILPRDAAEVSVVLVHRNRPAQLAEAIAGLHRQTLGGFEVVLVDDGSDAPAALAALESLAPDFAARGWRILRGPNAWLGAARNRGWRAARGRYVLFHDDDNIAMPQQIARLLGAAQASGAAVVTSLLAPFEGAVPQDPTRLLLALGGAVALGAYVNCFGDAGALVRRDVLEALGGFTEDWGLGHEDWELFARAALAGHEVLALPEAVFWYRIAPDSMLRTRPDDRPDHRRSLRAYTAPLPPVLRPAVLAALADAMALAGARAQAAAARQAAEARHGRILEQRRMIETQAQRLAELREALQARARRIATLQEELAAQKRMIAALRGAAGRPATPPPRAGSAVAPPADPGRPDDAET
jgi:GT2 family glycosyltransferase